MEIGELIFIGFCSLAAINALFFAASIWFKLDRTGMVLNLLNGSRTCFMN